jgi:hypothetical protein
MARALKDRLCEELGSDSVFMDVDSIDLGLDFVEAIEGAVAKVDVVIALIGRRWLDIKDAQGRRRIDNTNDFVRIEIVTALKRGIRLIPLLERGTVMPSPEELPEDLQPLARRNALEINDAAFKDDVGRLISSLHRIWERDKTGDTVTGDQMVRFMKKVMETDGQDESEKRPIPTGPPPAAAQQKPAPPAPRSSARAAPPRPSPAPPSPAPPSPASVAPPPVRSPVQPAAATTPVPRKSSKRSGRGLRWSAALLMLFLLIGASAVGACVIWPDKAADYLPPQLAKYLPDGEAKQHPGDHEDRVKSDEKTSPATLKPAPVEPPPTEPSPAEPPPIESPPTEPPPIESPPTEPPPIESPPTEPPPTESKTEVAEHKLDDPTQVRETGPEEGDRSPVGTVSVQPPAPAAQPKGTLTGVVFGDLNGNGVRDEHETGLPNVPLLVESAGRHTPKTDETGRYSIELAPGEASIQVDRANLPDHLVPVNEDPSTLMIEADSLLEHDLAVTLMGELEVIVFDDADGDGVQGEGESGLAGTQFVIVDSHGERACPISDANGKFSSTVPIGDVNIALGTSDDESQAPRKLTNEPPQQVKVSVEETECVVFALQQQAIVSGVVFKDLDGNGRQDGGETGIADIRMGLKDSSNQAHYQTTDGSGHYRFLVPPGPALVVVDPQSDLPKGAALTTNATGSKRGAAKGPSSHLDATGAEPAICNFGFQQQAKFKCTAFNDLNGNGRQDAGEPGIRGVKVQLTPSFGTASLHSTDTTGQFTAVVPHGRLAVIVDPSDVKILQDARITTKNQASMVDVPAGTTVGVSHGFHRRPKEVSTDGLKLADYKALLDQTKKEGKALVLVLHLQEVGVQVPKQGTQPAKSVRLAHGDKFHASLLKAHGSNNYLWVPSVTRANGQKQTVAGYVKVADLTPSVRVSTRSPESLERSNPSGNTGFPVRPLGGFRGLNPFRGR